MWILVPTVSQTQTRGLAGVNEWRNRETRLAAVKRADVDGRRVGVFHRRAIGSSNLLLTISHSDLKASSFSSRAKLVMQPMGMGGAVPLITRQVRYA